MGRGITITTANVRVKRRYGILHFAFDLFMTTITGGLWLFWLLFKYLRNNS